MLLWAKSFIQSYGLINLSGTLHYLLIYVFRMINLFLNCHYFYILFSPATFTFVFIKKYNYYDLLTLQELVNIIFDSLTFIGAILVYRAKIAPMKVSKSNMILTISHLELCAASLLTQLLQCLHTTPLSSVTIFRIRT